MIVRELITRLGFDVDRRGVGEAEKATTGITRNANSAAESIRNIFAGLLGFAAVRTLIATADEMQNIRARLEALPQTVGGVNESFDEVARRASAAGVSVSAYASLYTKVGNAAKDYITTQEDLLGITDTVSKALAVGGASGQEASAVMTQFSQALASGVLQGDEFRSMAEAAPQYLDKLSEAIGIPREQLKKMASEGKLTARAVLDATRTMGDYFDKRFQAMPMTVGRAMVVVSNRFSAMLDRMNRSSNLITRLANVILSVMDSIEFGVGKVVDAFGGWENLLRLIGVTIGVLIGGKAISVLLALKAAGFAAMLPFLKMAAIIAAVSLVVEDLYVWIKGEKSITGDLLGPWVEWRDFVMGAVDAVSGAFRWLGTTIAAVAATIVGAFAFDKNLFLEGIKGMASQAGKLLPSLDGAMMPQMSPTRLAPLGPGPGAASVQSNTTVNVTVPPGTQPEQVHFLQKAAGAAFEGAGKGRLARDLAVLAP